jgi:Zn-dependent peptidase ImmA (M78 family)/transcriptional regulator with XRE-family HTH domain
MTATGPSGRAGSSDFDGSRLTLARRLNRKSKTALASSLGVSASAITQYEKGTTRPTPAMAAKISLLLGLDRGFFGAGRPVQALPSASAHFRSLRSTTAMAREQALAYGELSLELLELIELHVELPAADLPDVDPPSDLTQDDIELSVAQTKQHWSVPPGPVSHMVRLLEAHGVLVLKLPDNTDRKVDAFSTDAGHRPLVFLSPEKNDKARSRFDAAHELGHLVLHPDNEPGSKLLENQAHAFAAEFLMPRAEIIDQLPRRADWPTFHALKRHWGVSLRALVFRARFLGTLSEASYRRANQQLSMWGYPEPGPLGPPESPSLLGAAVDILAQHGVDLDELLNAGRLDRTQAQQVISAGTEVRPKLQLGGSESSPA